MAGVSNHWTADVGLPYLLVPHPPVPSSSCDGGGGGKCFGKLGGVRRGPKAFYHTDDFLLYISLIYFFVLFYLGTILAGDQGFPLS